jgi:uncharacterized protein YjdB
MKKNLFKKVGPIFIIGIVCVLYFLMHQLGAVNADSVPYYLRIKNTTTAIGESGIELTNGSVIVEVESYSGTDLGNITDIEWIVSNQKVNTTTPITTTNALYSVDNMPNGAVSITPNKVGVDEVYVNIKATINGEAKTFTLSFKVSSNLYINTNNGSGLLNINNENYQVLEVGASNNFTLLQQSLLFNSLPLNNASNVNALGSVYWNSSNEKVLSFTNGKTLNILGAGLATVTAKDLNGKVSVSFKVIVKPKLNYSGSDVTPGTVLDIPTASLPNFIIGSNASDINVLKWRIYDYKTNALVNSSKVSTVEGGQPARLNITANKAGKYEIFTSVFDNESLFLSTIQDTINNFEISTNKDLYTKGYSRVTVNVPLKYNATENIALLMGDEFDVLGRTNAPSDLTIASIDGYQGVLDYNAETKKLTAVAEGIKTITVKTNDYKDANGNVILPAIQYTLNITVTNTLALNSTKLTMYKGSSYLLEATPNDDVSFISDNTGVVTVDSSGKVTAVSAGHATVTASKTVNGVTRKATCYITVKDAVTGITITPKEKTIDIGEYVSVYANIDPSNINNQDVSIKWISSNPDVATIEASENSNKTVVVKGVSSGTATITAIDTNNIVIGSAIISVNKSVTAITLSHTSVTANLSQRSIQLVAYFTPTDASNRSITWKSSDTTVATVDANGLVTYVGSGKATIIATSVSDPSVTAMCNVTVTIPVTGLTLDAATKSIQVGKSERITYTVIPTNATNNAVTWLSTNTTVATVSSTGYVTGVAVGQAVIIARTADGNILQYCNVNVTTKPTGISLDKSELTMNKDEYTFLYATLTPANTSENTIIWSTTDEAVVSVTQAGKVTAKGAGTALIIAKDSSGNSVYCKVTVVEAVKDIKLNFSKKTLKKGNTFKLKATFTPTTATNKKVTWISSNKSVASVASDGTVKGLKGGIVVITARSVDGNYADSCIVTVTETVTKIKLNKSYYKLGKGKSYRLIATVYNSTATNKAVKWKSSNKSVATVDSKGRVTGKKLGYATITAYATDGSGVETTCEIRVVNQVTSIKLNKTAITLVEGRSTKLKATIKPTNATYKTGSWKSSDSSVVSVSSNGTLTALKVGTATVTVSAKDSSGKTATCFVNVIKAVPATSVSILSQDVTMVVGETSYLHKTVSPANSTDSTRWYSADTSIVSVNSSTGKITARKAGVATITCVAGGKSDTVKVTVVGLNRSSITLEQYSTYNLAVYGVTSGVSWDVLDPEVCRISATGQVTSARIGVTYVTATVNGRKLYCRVTVVPIR